MDTKPKLEVKEDMKRKIEVKTEEKTMTMKPPVAQTPGEPWAGALIQVRIQANSASSSLTYRRSEIGLHLSRS